MQICIIRSRTEEARYDRHNGVKVFRRHRRHDDYTGDADFNTGSV